MFCSFVDVSVAPVILVAPTPLVVASAIYAVAHDNADTDVNDGADDNL